MKNFQYILCRNREDYAAASEHIFYVEDLCNWFSTFCAETVQLIFFYIGDCMTASINISMFFKERVAAS